MRSPLIFLLSLTFLLISCHQDKRQQIAGTCFGTMYHITYLGDEDKNLPARVDSLLAELNSTFSIFDTASLISHVNAGKSSIVNADFEHVLRCATEVARHTGGAFDFTVQPLVELWGFGRNKEPRQVALEQLDSVRQFVNYKLVALHDSVLVRVDPRTQLNFNAIAKGYAVDKMAQFLLQQGYDNFIVEIGGEVVCHGTKDGKPGGKSWVVGIQVPTATKDGAVESSVRLEPGKRAVATSGNYRNYFEKEGKRYTHILDPRTGTPEETNLLSVTVLAPDCMTADAYATAFMVLGVERSMELLSQHPELDAYFIYDEKGEYQTMFTDFFASEQN
ncbi:MAG: FAD:protein FMN transferase [Bacteroidales bacterium]|nr:FAD:protein FMN transferase [Bacteroidales bacterium]